MVDASTDTMAAAAAVAAVAAAAAVLKLVVKFVADQGSRDAILTGWGDGRPGWRGWGRREGRG
jgi:hypothetical protein